MTDPDTVARDYLALWNDPDVSSRQSRLKRHWADDALYNDPMTSAGNWTGINDMIGAARDQFPGHAFSLTGKPDGYDNFVRFSWLLSPEGGQPVAGGTDIVRLDVEGRITQVIGFLDRAPT